VVDSLGFVRWLLQQLGLHVRYERSVRYSGGLMIPDIVALLGITFPPGRKRSLGLALFGAMAPVSAAGGSLVSAVTVQLSERKFLFFLLRVLNPPE
jgi:hypothetical protein